MMPRESRLCFVIMPFSGTAAATEDEWTDIFEHTIRPAVEAAGPGYVCRRSTADRGNFVKGILRQLSDAWVVIADLTDRNANVYYELGVRHALTDRTILVAQELSDVPSDLRSYATVAYGWKTQNERDRFAADLARVLEEVDSDPERADNPVSDFLGRVRSEHSEPHAGLTERVARLEGEVAALRTVMRADAGGRTMADQAIAFLSGATAFDPPPDGLSWRGIAEALSE